MYKDPNPYNNFDLGKVVRTVVSGGLSNLKPAVATAVITGGVSNITRNNATQAKVESKISGVAEPVRTPTTPTTNTTDAASLATAAAAAAEEEKKKKQQQYIIYGIVGLLLVGIVVYVLK
jgi:hypothetical protein